MHERIGEFELVRHIATGGMAEVYLARHADSGDGPPVVIKRMLPELAVRPAFVQMFIDEATLAQRLRHPNIVEVFHLGQEGERYYIAMELIDGPHLGLLFGHSIRSRRPLPVELCAYIVARAADGLHAAHETADVDTGEPMNIVHRDISPQNILVARQGDVKVTDFGVAKATTQQTKTRTGVVKGKVSYMSPEQCLGERVDRRTDVFALGVVLYELLTRKRLFREKSDLLVMQRITTELVPPPSTRNPELDRQIDDICASALARERTARTPDAAQLAESLDAWVASRGIRNPRAALRDWFATHALGLRIGEEAPREPDSLSGPAEEETNATASAPVVRSLLPTLLGDDATVVRHVTHPLDAGPADVDRTEDADLLDETAASSRNPRTESGVEELEEVAGSAAPHGRSAATSAHAERAGTLVRGAGQRRSIRGRGAVAAAARGGLLVAGMALVAGRAGVQESPSSGTAPAGGSQGAPGSSGAAERLGRITVESVPSGVSVLVDDGERIERTPVTIERPAGSVKLVAQWPDQAPLAETVDVTAGSTHRVVLLARVPLVVESVPPHAKVRIDGELLGETPLHKPGQVFPGRPVEVRVELPGFVPLVQSHVPQPGVPLVVTAALARTAGGTRPRPASFGLLNMRSTPWVEAKVQGMEGHLGDTPLAQVRVPAGRQTLVLTNPEFGIRDTVTIVIPESRAVSLVLEWEQGPDGGWRIKDKRVR